MGNPPPRDEPLGLKSEICFFAIEEGDETDKGEEAEILVITTKSSWQPSKNYINPFNRDIIIWL